MLKLHNQVAKALRARKDLQAAHGRLQTARDTLRQRERQLGAAQRAAKSKAEAAKAEYDRELAAAKAEYDKRVARAKAKFDSSAGIVESEKLQAAVNAARAQVDELKAAVAQASGPDFALANSPVSSTPLACMADAADGCKS